MLSNKALNFFIFFEERKVRKHVFIFSLWHFIKLFFHLVHILGLENLSLNNTIQIAQNQGDYDLYFSIAELIWNDWLEALN